MREHDLLKTFINRGLFSLKKGDFNYITVKFSFFCRF
jgi:hypothetical protein